MVRGGSRSRLLELSFLIFTAGTLASRRPCTSLASSDELPQPVTSPWWHASIVDSTGA